MKPTTTKRRYRRRRRHTNNTSQFVQPAQSEDYMEETDNHSFLSAGERNPTPSMPFIIPAHAPSEQQAEAISEQVVKGRPATSLLSSKPTYIQRQEMEQEDISKKPEEPEKISRLEEEEVSRMPSNKAVDKMANMEERIATKSEGGGTPAVSQGFAGGLKSTKGKGSPMSHTTQAEMSSAFGVDFSSVRIHTNQQAEQLSSDIHAQAFTHGKDIYFNAGKYNPNTPEGKKLLAHELTHVVQQSKEGDAKRIHRRQIPGTSTPVPQGFNQVRDKKRKVFQAVGDVAVVTVTIKSDIEGTVYPGRDGETRLGLSWNAARYNSRNGMVTRITRAPSVTLTIQTTYRKGVDPDVPSTYGRGTTAADRTAGNTSLRFHEGSHGTFGIHYLQGHSLPQFMGNIGMSVADFDQAIADFNQAMTAYNTAMQQANIQAIDCVGTPGDICTP